ncbi:MAG: SGNH/GDSL hydrolase family protein [Solirubrobacterales bacterium]|nr:SGNH/GDSL hydrolase family protein [Solirubrobacterales bacterium]
MSSFTRFVAIGDSTTEGVGDDPYADGRDRGWADRFAEELTKANPALLYANLAIRGRLIAPIREEQLEPALALKPDLASVIGGLNDAIRPSFELEAVLAEMELMQSRLRDQGATVLTITYPDLSSFAPMARLVRARMARFNAGLRAVAGRTGATLLDFEAAHPSSDPRLWCPDRLHPNAAGHARIAAGAAEVLSLPGSDGSWAAPLPALPPLSAPERIWTELHWVGAFMLPWVGRRLTGRSSGDGRAAKRPRMLPLEASA